MVIKISKIDLNVTTTESTREISGHLGRSKLNGSWNLNHSQPLVCWSVLGSHTQFDPFDKLPDTLLRLFIHAIMHSVLLHPFMARIYHLIMATSSMIMPHVTKHKLSQSGSMNTKWWIQCTSVASTVNRSNRSPLHSSWVRRCQAVHTTCVFFFFCWGCVKLASHWEILQLIQYTHAKWYLH